METVFFILLLLGAISLFGAFLASRPNPTPVNYHTLLALGLLFWILVPLIQAAQNL